MTMALTDHDYAMTHRYRLEHEGPFVPGVTTVINMIDKPGLKWSASGIAAQAAIENTRRKASIVKAYREKLLAKRGKGESIRLQHELAMNGTANEVYAHWCRGQFDVQWREKANRGTRVHDIAERLTRGESVDVRGDDIGFVTAWQRFYEEYQPTFHFIECIVGGHAEGSPYGGRFDFIAELHGPDADGLYLNDYKTGKEYADTNALQAIGYKKAEFIHYDALGSISGLTPLPVLQGCRTIYLHEDGTIAAKDPFERIDEDDAWRAFSACNTLYATMNIINDAVGKDSDE
jgi:hypothetical protein